MYNKNDKWDVLEIILMAQDNEKEHEDWLNSLSEEEFEEHLRRCHLTKTLSFFLFERSERSVSKKHSHLNHSPI